MQGDFLGFSFDGIHSSELNITRVSDGDRYSESLTPDMEDKIISVPGEDGSYFFGSLYRNKPITIPIAFDSLNESQFRQLRKLLAIRKPCQLIFDERPYKVYTAKISSPPQLNYICFDEPKKKQVVKRQGIRIINRDTEPKWEDVYPYVYDDEKERIYKGEGTIEFTCVQPYATEQIKMLDYYGDFNFQPVWGNGVVYKNNPRTLAEAQALAIADGVPLEEEDPRYPSGSGHMVPSEAFVTTPKYHVISLDSGNSITKYTNVQEWAESSGILPYEFYTLYNIDKVCEVTDVAGYNAYIPVYNAGDIDTPFYLFLPYNEESELNPGEDELIDINLGNNVLKIKPFKSETTLDKENGIVINTKNHLIEGVLYDYNTSAWRTTGNIYNEYIEAGSFNKIKNNDWSIFDTYDGSHTQAIYLNCETAMGAKIHYNYLYY